MYTNALLRGNNFILFFSLPAAKAMGDSMLCTKSMFVRTYVRTVFA